MRHHHYQRHLVTTLTLPTAEGRYEVFQAFECACGESLSCTSYALNTGRHLTVDELKLVQAKEQARPQHRRRA